MNAMTTTRARGLARLLAALSACICASHLSAQAAASKLPPVSPDAIREAQEDSARLPYTKADIDFMSGMIGHHSQALVMSGWAPSHGASPSVQTLAGRIINEQTDEINLMTAWLRARRQPVPDPSTMGMKMTMNGKEMVMLMPGMLTDDQMKELDAARGPTFDRLFLTDMIQHHRGAVSMVHQLFETTGAGQDEAVFKYASDVNVDQSTEIARMEKLLAALTFGVQSSE
jgi:uncharacterized protein (DUF305 family)